MTLQKAIKGKQLLLQICGYYKRDYLKKINKKNRKAKNFIKKERSNQNLVKKKL
jgi:predicted nuclease of restriction endonuclease-like RecB superfamily